MTILLLGSPIEPKQWNILHTTKSYKEMAEVLDLYCDRSKYQAFAVVQDKYFDTESKMIVDEKNAFAETPAFVEDAFVEAMYHNDRSEA